MPLVLVAVKMTTRTCGNGEELSAVPDEPKYFRFARVSGTRTRNPSRRTAAAPATASPIPRIGDRPGDRYAPL